MTQYKMLASVREMRHIIGRFLHGAQCPSFAVNAVRDALLAAQAEGYDAVSLLEETAQFMPDSSMSFTITSTPSTIELDGNGGLSYMLAPAFVDELALAVHCSTAERVFVLVRNVKFVDLFTKLHEYAGMRRIEYSLSDLEDNCFLVGARRTDSPYSRKPRKAAGPAMEHALKEGYLLPESQYWRMFHTSNLALAPESEVSRRHAGSQRYDEHGNMLGEIDEEAYQHIRSTNGNHVHEGALA